MSKADSMSKELASEIKTAAETLLTALAEEYGMGVSLSKGRFDNSTMRLKVEFLILEGDAGSTEEALWRKSAKKFGFPDEWFGKTFRNDQGEFQVVGIRPKAKKKLVLIKELRTEKRFACSGTYLVEAMKKEAKRR